jgi:E3 ubiquitin-protein ligase HUWE1
VIRWYWEILEEYTNEELAKIVQFITGTSKIPHEGFSKLQGMHGPQKIAIFRCSDIDQLPKSHTCFNQLDLPEYPSKETLKEKLRVVITWGSEGFGFI